MAYWANGNGVSYPQTLVIGAFKDKKHFYCNLALIYPPIPAVIGASWVIIHRPVFVTDFIKV